MRRLPLLLALLAPLLHAQERYFTPAVADPAAPNRVALDVRPGNGLQVVQAELNGKPCRLLFDTGASHTTFDRAFLQREFPELPLQPIALGGVTNVTSAPAAFPVKSLKLGQADLRDFIGMALPLGHLSGSVGDRVDGILGMNAMAYAPFLLSVGDGEVLWNPPAERLEGFRALPLHDDPGDNSLSLVARHAPDGKPFPMLVDSGSSLTFAESAFWPAQGETFDFAASSVNAASAASVQRGEPGELRFGDLALKASPLLDHPCGATLGADILRILDLYFDARRPARAILGRQRPNKAGVDAVAPEAGHDHQRQDKNTEE